MKNDTYTLNFEDVCELVGGSQPSKDDFIYEPKDGYIRLIQVRDFRTDKFITYIPKDKARRFCNKEDIMIGRYGPPIFGIFKGLEGAYNVALMKAVINEKICNKDYFYWFLNTDSLRQFVEHSSKRAAGQDGVRKELLDKYPVFVPPIPEQQRIVSILDEAFAAIAKAKANAEQNLKNAKELFESYLQGVFEKKVHGEKFDSLDNLCELIVDCEHKTAPTQETGYPSIRTPNIGKGDLILEGVNRVSYETYVEWTKRAIPQAGDLILAREAPAGNIAVIPENVEVCLGQRTVLLRPKKDKLMSRYLAYLILSKEVQAILLSHSTGATVQHINMKDIRAFKIYNLSNLTEQESNVKQLDALRFETQKLEAVYQKKIADLEELKKSILQKAFSGELRTEKV